MSKLRRIAVIGQQERLSLFVEVRAHTDKNCCSLDSNPIST
jgi:hypothetical protein